MGFKIKLNLQLWNGTGVTSFVNRAYLFPCLFEVTPFHSDMPYI